MDQAASDRIQQELEGEAKRLFPGAIRRVALLQHGDDPVAEPGEIVLRLVVIVTPGEDGELPEPHAVLKPSAMKQFRHELSQRLPEARRTQILLEDADGHPLKGRFMMRFDGEDRPAEGDFTPVMARLRPAELDIVDTLISAGIAANRAEAVRWALARISERPAYAQLREHARDIERLKTEF
jgi:hypothetical protein